MPGKRVLIAPLNWGLGHATRTIPLIKKLITSGCEVILACDGVAGTVLRNEFPNLAYHELPSYQIRYPRKYHTLFWIKQIPRLVEVVSAEHDATSRLVQKYKFDWIISDNRYGVFSDTTVNILISHQTRLLLPPWIAPVANHQLKKWITRFDECWIPDLPPPDSLSGKLSTPVSGIPTRYMGLQSRMHVCPGIKPAYDLCMVLSGPEPQRSLLQDRLEKLHLEDSFKTTWVLGTPDRQVSSGSGIFSHLNSSGLNELLCDSGVVISRSGYTSLMDYYRLGKKAILIPTRGQPEQEYLAQLHGDKAGFARCEPESLDDLPRLVNMLLPQPDPLRKPCPDFLSELLGGLT